MIVYELIARKRMKLIWHIKCDPKMQWIGWVNLSLTTGKMVLAEISIINVLMVTHGVPSNFVSRWVIFESLYQ